MPVCICVWIHAYSGARYLLFDRHINCDDRDTAFTSTRHLYVRVSRPYLNSGSRLRQWPHQGAWNLTTHACVESSTLSKKLLPVSSTSKESAVVIERASANRDREAEGQSTARNRKRKADEKKKELGLFVVRARVIMSVFFILDWHTCTRRCFTQAFCTDKKDGKVMYEMRLSNEGLTVMNYYQRWLTLDGGQEFTCSPCFVVHASSKKSPIYHGPRPTGGDKVWKLWVLFQLFSQPIF